MPVVPGTRLGPYEILDTLGAGGMGEVYRARDLRLDRIVAVKVLPDHLAQNLNFRARFAREARAVAALSHPHILTIHDFGVDAGIPYAVTELLEGETLRAALDRGPLPWRRALDFGVMLAEGLSAAHGKGIVHRDLKPENIFLTSACQLKILDFGLAQLESAAEPGETGAIEGTLGYMSPEQIRGQKAEASTDIFALGCVLYEMLSGRRAFPQTSLAAILEAIRKGGLADVCDLDRRIPLPAGRIVARCLEDKPEARYRSARDLAFHLREILTSGATRIEPDRVTSLAVLPFACERLEGESEYLSDGLTESIINHLTRLRRLRVAARSIVFRYKGKDVDCLAVARDLEVDAILTGRLVRRGDHLTIQAELTRAADGTQIWGQRFNRRFADIFDVEEEIGRDISEALRLELTGKEVEQLGKRYTQSSSAYQSYLQGRYHWKKRSPDGLAKSVEHFSQAIAFDPEYALAYCGLADTYGMLAMYRFSRPQDAVPQAIHAARKAVEIDPDLAEAQASLAFWTMNYEWTWESSEAAFERAIELDPQHAGARQWYAASLLCRGRMEEALASAKAALVLDPLSLSGNATLGWVYHFSGRFEEAIEQYRKTLELDPEFLLGYHFVAMSYEQKGMYEEAIAACQHAAKLPGGIAVITGSLIHTYAKAGRPEKARAFLEELLRRRETAYVPAYDLAIIYAGLGERDQALAWLSEACNERSTWLTYLRLDRRLDDLRDDPRFAILLRRVGLA